MIWYFLRHAEKERGEFYNPHLQIHDEPLSPRGFLSAQKLVAQFADKPVSAIYVSAYQRTLQTSAALAGHFHLTPVVDARLNEINNGAVGNMLDAEFHKTSPCNPSTPGRSCFPAHPAPAARYSRNPLH